MCQNSFELFDRTVYQVCGAWQWDNVRQWSRPVFCGRSGADTVHPLLSFTYHYGLSKDFIWSTHWSPHIWPEPGNTWTMIDCEWEWRETLEDVWFCETVFRNNLSSTDRDHVWHHWSHWLQLSIIIMTILSVVTRYQYCWHQWRQWWPLTQVCSVLTKVSVQCQLSSSSDPILSNNL